MPGSRFSRLMSGDASCRDCRFSDRSETGTLDNRWRLWLRFNVIGAIGIIVQTGALLAGARLIHLNYLVATVAAVEAAITHNFVWHLKWTWVDRRLMGGPRSARDVLSLFLRFNTGAGAVSLFGNLFLMRMLVGAWNLNLVAASLISIVLCSLLNFLIADRVIFRKRNSHCRS